MKPFPGNRKNRMSRKVFTSQKISIFLLGQEFQVQALVSIYGAKNVFDEEDIPDEAKACLGIEIQVIYKGIPIRCRFVRESNPAGSFYSLRFIQPSNLLLKQIEKDISVSGIPSPWIRGLPRLNAEIKHLPVPVLAVVSFGSNTFYMQVKNFTLGGILLEYNGRDLDALGVGLKLVFDLITNGGDKFPEISGIVKHLSVEKGDAMLDNGRYQIGIRFLEFRPATELRYRELIREHCLGLKGDPSSDQRMG